MNTADLIPVLKSLHANPSTSCVFADWFEERGDNEVAMKLRTCGCNDPVALIRSMTIWPSYNNLAIRQAVAAAAMDEFQSLGRLGYRGDTNMAIACASSVIRNHIEIQTGIAKNQWVSVCIDNSQTANLKRDVMIYYIDGYEPEANLFRIPAERCSPTPFRTAVAVLRYTSLEFRTPTVMLTGEELTLAIDAWFGTSYMDGRDVVLVGELVPEHVRARLP